MRTAKAWWKSKTLLVNLPVMLAGALAFVLDVLGALPPDALPEHAATIGLVTSVLSAVNSVLRLRTREAVASRDVYPEDGLK